ncbi:hypothetical protein [Clostridium oryzae]|uniref:DUF8042 domain-containing protein n=1 Tax=Clostridium oryzae TaxID=1450648 RepID=A0A1V4IM87_9CLOT|nr:hypothetical protein [Clostridium oryzae]OPJ60885.1 hypothetical protein CLORY_25920 [Clostridium oryzae]
MDKKFELLMTVSESINYLLAKAEEISTYFAEGRDSDASNHIGVFIDDLSLTIKAINLTENVQKEKIDTSEINEVLNSMVEAFENSDFILLGDLFQYELSPILQKWNDKISMNTFN